MTSRLGAAQLRQSGEQLPLTHLVCIRRGAPTHASTLEARLRQRALLLERERDAVPAAPHRLLCIRLVGSPGLGERGKLKLGLEHAAVVLVGRRCTVDRLRAVAQAV